MSQLAKTRDATAVSPLVLTAILYQARMRCSSESQRLPPARRYVRCGVNRCERGSVDRRLSHPDERAAGAIRLATERVHASEKAGHSDVVGERSSQREQFIVSVPRLT